MYNHALFGMYSVSEDFSGGTSLVSMQLSKAAAGLENVFKIDIGMLDGVEKWMGYRFLHVAKAAICRDY
jgi:hypothetical protein